MGYEYAYELMAAVFLVIMIACYHRKNWLMLRANVVFQIMLCVSVLVSLIDITASWLWKHRFFHTEEARGLAAGLAAAGMVIMLVVFLTYLLALTERLDFIHDKLFLVVLAPAAVVCLLFITSPWNHIVFYYIGDKKGVELGGGSSLAALVILGYWLAVVGTILSAGKEIRPIRKICMLVLLVLPLLTIFFQYYVWKGSSCLLYYSMSLLVAYCYMFFQNKERYSDRISGGFSRAGFRRVVQEQCLYQQDFACLSIDIQNYQNIANICDEEGIAQVMGQIGSVLRKLGGRHNQFHIHSSEFLVMQKSVEEGIRVYEDALRALPQTMRIDNRTIVINYAFYLLTMEEAQDNPGDFYQILSSMKRQLKFQTDKRKLMRYEGSVKEAVDTELLIGRKLKRILATRENEIRFVPVIDAQVGRTVGLECLLFMNKDNGETIPMEDIMEVAKEMGCMNAIGSIFLENVLDLVTREHILDHGIQRLHINILPLQICSEIMVRSYQDIAAKYKVPMDRICLEITEDMGVSYEVMFQYASLLKEAGACLLLDQYGINVCNLQSIMDMPFDIVKIHRDLIKWYCSGESEILEYQVKMLQEAGFQIGLDGIDSQEDLEKLRHMTPDYLQGDLYAKPMAAEKLMVLMKTGKIAV